MYLPNAFKEERVSILHDAIRGAGLATLVSLTDEGLTNKGVPPALPGRQQKFDISRSRLPRSVDGTPNSEPPSARKESRQRGSHEK